MTYLPSTGVRPYHPEFGRSRPNGANGINVGMEIRRKIGLLESRLSKSRKVIGTYTDRSGNYDLL